MKEKEKKKYEERSLRERERERENDTLSQTVYHHWGVSFDIVYLKFWARERIVVFLSLFLSLPPPLPLVSASFYFSYFVVVVFLFLFILNVIFEIFFKKFLAIISFIDFAYGNNFFLLLSVLILSPLLLLSNISIIL